jgi:fatty-acyl-CoA synthase
MILGKVISKRAMITPERVAVISRGHHYTYQQLNLRCMRLANALLKLGVEYGDRVGLLMPNNIEFLETYFATAKIGAVLVPVNTRLTGPEIDFILNDCTVKVFIFAKDYEETVAKMNYPASALFRVSTVPCKVPDTLDYETLIREAPENEPDVRIHEDDLHIIMYTSGTTGRPKGAMLTHKNIYSGGLDMLIGLHYHYPECLLVLVPLFHSGGITPVVGHVIKGVCTVLMESFEPVEALKLIEKYDVSLLLGVTTIIKMLLHVPDLESYHLESLKTAILPGSPLPYQTIKEAHDRMGVLCQNLWGLTEMTGPGSHTTIEDVLEKPECAGKPYFNVDLRIVDFMGKDVPAGEIGEIIARGPNMMQGYWNLPEETAETIKDGWLHTGDMGRIDEQGYLYVVDRIKDMIVSGGENVYPAEIEKVILEIPGVADVSVIGIADDKWGETPKAYIELHTGATVTQAEIESYCRTKLAGYKIPRHIEFIEALPRNPTGKVLKKELRKFNSHKR